MGGTGGAAGALGDGAASGKKAADAVLVGGRVWVGPGAQTTALAVRDGAVVAHGPAAQAQAGRAAQVIDLEGGLVAPGFGDGHCHPVFGGLETQGPSIAGAGSVEQIAAAVRSYARDHPGERWIVGASYDPALRPDGAFDAAWLDEAVPDRPVLLRANDYHTVWANSAALAEAGVTAGTPDPPLGRIDRRPDGRPLGTLREWDACDLVLRAAPERSPVVLRRALAEACRRQNLVGVTWMQDAWVDAGGHRPYLELLERDALTVRSNLGLRADPARWRDQVAEFGLIRAEVEAAGRPDLLTCRTVKFFADGVIESGTGAMLEPYVGTTDRGMAVWRASDLSAAVTAFDAAGFQCHLHAIGDAAVRDALDAVGAAVRANPAWDRRPVIAHVQVVDPDDLGRFAALGVVANFESYWSQCDPLQNVLTSPRLGPARAALQYPAASLVRSGATISHGSDWPVSTNDPLEALRVAVTRLNDHGRPAGGWIPAERLTVEQALAAATAGAAFQGWTDSFRGTLDLGKQADLVIYDRDWLDLDPAGLRGLTPRATWLSGRPVP
ncbi:MAG: amidohydrolase [Bifidobacteriaceae bacterium]|jgi:predicted amidohydrolase YtcJ|nr:amidohydrolase [Bifidobacteriaceae bacterium]